MKENEFLHRLHGTPAPKVDVNEQVAGHLAKYLKKARRKMTERQCLEYLTSEVPLPPLTRPARKVRTRIVGKRVRMTIKESCDCDNATLDVSKSTLKNVLLLSSNSKNGRRYTDEAMTSAVAQYEGIKVNLDHPVNNPNSPRSLRDRVGKIVNARMTADGIRGDLIYNPYTDAGKSLAWWSKNAPDCLGMSHNAVGQGVNADDGTFVVEKIVAVRSVDLVADPATTGGLFGKDGSVVEGRGSRRKKGRTSATNEVFKL